MSSRTSPAQASDSPPGAILVSTINSQAVYMTATTINQTISALKANKSSYSEAFQIAYAFYIYPPTACPIYPAQKPLDVALHTDVLFDLLTYSGREANEAACRLLMEIGLAVGWRVRRLGKETSQESEVFKGKGEGKGWQKYAAKHKDRIEVMEAKPSSSSKKPETNSGPSQPAKRKQTRLSTPSGDDRRGKKRQRTRSAVWTNLEYETSKHDVSMQGGLNEDISQIDIVVKHPGPEILGASYFAPVEDSEELSVTSLARRESGIGSEKTILGVSYFIRSMRAFDDN